MNDNYQWTDEIPVNPSSAQAVILTALRYLAVLVAGFTSLLGIIGRGDLQELITYFQSETGLTLITTIITVGSIGWGIYTRYQSHRDKVRAADPRDPAQLVLKK